MFEPTGTYASATTRYDTMLYKRCGASGLKLPAISLGFWHNFGDITPYDQMRPGAHRIRPRHHALRPSQQLRPRTRRRGEERGTTDPAIPRRPPRRTGHQHQGRLRDVVGPYGDWGSRKYLLASLDQSLERLGLDYVDIFYHHRPDPETPLEETMGALAQAVASGKALYVGLSNYDGPQLERAATILDELHVPFIINQNKYNIFDRTVERNGLKDTAKHLARVSSRSARSRRVC